MDKKRTMVLDENDSVIVQLYNEKKANTQMALQKHSLGKGKVARTIDAILIGATAIFETIRELPGFEYLKTMSISNLTTKFNNWLASITSKTPDLTGLTAEEIFELGKQIQLQGSNSMANSWGMLFSAVLEFVLQHPTVAMIGVTTLIGVLSIPFKALINKIRENREAKEIIDVEEKVL